MDVREVWYGRTPFAVLIRILLLPFSAIYWMGWQLYLAIYSSGLKRPYRARIPVLAVGNFTVGGSGKTPVAIEVARTLMDRGWQVVIGCSGYGSPRSEAASVASDVPLDPAEWGDEPAMIQWLLPGVPLIVGRRRVLAAQLCEQKFPDAVLVMDDGLQHLPLHVDLRMALDDPEAPNRFVLPAGPYREPVSKFRFELLFPGRFRIERSIESLVEPSGVAVSTDPRDVPQVHALAALARPAVFFDELRQRGWKVVREMALPDHDPLTAGTLLDSFEPEIPLIVTAKDWVKLSRRADLAGRTIWIAMQSTAIEPHAEFADWLHATTQKIAQEKADG